MWRAISPWVMIRSPGIPATGLCASVKNGPLLEWRRVLTCASEVAERLGDERVGDGVQGDDCLGQRQDTDFWTCRKKCEIATYAQFCHQHGRVTIAEQQDLPALCPPTIKRFGSTAPSPRILGSSLRTQTAASRTSFMI
jgi:hypothetical protein